MKHQEGGKGTSSKPMLRPGMSVTEYRAYYWMKDDLVRFDLALTVSVMRYASDVHAGKVNPKVFCFGFDVDRKRSDLADLLTQRLINAADIPAAMGQLEPPFDGYRRAEKALLTYLVLAREDDGELLPATSKKSVEPGDSYPGAARLERLLRRLGDLPPDAKVPPNSQIYDGVLVEALKRFQERHGIDPDGRIGKTTLKQLNVPLSWVPHRLLATHWNAGLTLSPGAKPSPFLGASAVWLFRPAFNFLVEIEGILAGSFSECTGLQVETEYHDYREGGLNDYVHRFAGPTKYPPLMLKHGITQIDGLWNWHQEVTQGSIKRKNGTIYLLDRMRIPVMYWNFKEAFFYPLNGAYKCIAADFDGDGDLDIAAISFFPDYDKSPEESFVFLENQGGLQFRAHTFPDCYRGRWLTMDAGDLDGDGDLDIVLGGAYKTPFRATERLLERWQKEGPSLLILRNQLIEKKSKPRSSGSP